MVQENDVAAISGMDSEGYTPPSFLDVLDLQHWTHLLDATIAHEEKGLQMLEEIRDKLHDMILADGSIEDLDNKIRVIDMASPNANTGNANTPDNDVMMSMSALFLKRKSLTWACLFDETIKACWAQVMDGSQPLKCSKPLTPPIPSVLFDHKCSIAEGVIIKTQQNLPTVFDQDAKVVAL
ncbi:unnamed protein product [Sphagnum jensenii]|uniref:Uncharacterized protein n=1 Tax=Sphagnum jensenii TaxID=128206 RepID=A0ABP1AFV2_9BRYO